MSREIIKIQEAAHQVVNGITMNIQESQRHKGHHMSNVHGRSRRVDPSVDTDSPGGQKVIELLSLARRMSDKLHRKSQNGSRGDAPDNLVDISSLFKQGQHALHLSLADMTRLELPLFLGRFDLVDVSFGDPPRLSGWNSKIGRMAIEEGTSTGSAYVERASSQPG